MATTTKKDLIDRIADTTQQRRADVKKTVQAFLDQVIDELGRGNRLEFRDFGVFEIKDRAPRVAQNPKTLERVHVPARRTVKFKVGRLMRETLEQPGVEQELNIEVVTTADAVDCRRPHLIVTFKRRLLIIRSRFHKNEFSTS